MKYVLLNRDNVVVDILSQLRYIKLQPSNNYVIGCEEEEGTGVIGSDDNTHYPLIKTDMTSNHNAVSVMAIEEIPSDVIANFSKYDAVEQKFICDFAEMQRAKQNQNKTMFADYLASNPTLWVDGKLYGITAEDQSEITLKLVQYQVELEAGIENPALEWHAKQEENVPWTYENLSALYVQIAETVYPVFHKMQQYKTAIYGATSIEELNAIAIEY